MPVTKDQAQMLAALAVACRPKGAPHWDAPGVVAVIGRVNNLLLADVAHAVIRAAEDPTAQTPGVIAATSSVHWRERSPHRTVPTPPKPGEACRTCGKAMPCGCDEPTLRPIPPTTDATPYAEQAREAIRNRRSQTTGDLQ